MWWVKRKTATIKEEIKELERGISCHQDAILLPNSHDSCPVKLFKLRGLEQHEGFNGTTKSFQIL